MANIHQTAIIDPSAQLGEDVLIGAGVIIGKNVIIGNGTHVEARSFIDDNTEIGSGCYLSVGAVLGTPPQDHSYKGEQTKVIIGNNTQIREYSTVHRATGEGKITSVGNDCMLMAYSHVAHNTSIGNGVVLASYGAMGGHISVGDNCVIGGLVAAHQFVRIGKLAIISGFSATRMDIPPFSITDGRPALVKGVNKVGLRRNGYSRTEIDNLRKAFKIMYFDDVNLTQAVEIINSNDDLNNDPNVQHLINFMKSSKRGVKRQTESSSF